MKRGARIAAGTLVGLLLVGLLFRTTDWRAVGQAIRSLDVGWLMLGQVFAWSSHFARAQRFGYVVRASHPARYRSLFSSTQIGFLVNAALPARLGELVRAVVLARLEKQSASGALSMVVLDRASDLIGLLAVFLVALFAFPFETSVEVAPGVLGNPEAFVLESDLVRLAVLATTALVVTVVAVLVLLYIRQGTVLALLDATIGRLSPRLAGTLRGTFTRFAAGMHVFRSPVELWLSLVLTLALWLANALSLTCLFAAFGFEFTWSAPFVVLALIAVGVSIPIAPGMIGQYHVGVIAGLLLAVPALPAADMQAVALVAHATSLLPVAVLGVYALALERLSFLDLVRSSAGGVRDQNV